MKQIIVLMAALIMCAGTATAGTNRGDVMESVEADAAAGGWNIIWGEHIGHDDYLACAVSMEACIGDMLYGVIDSFGREVAEEIVSDWGRIVVIDSIEFKGNFASYNHWKKTPFGRIPLPNTHQPYVLWRE